jgi:hypothetical protein
LGTFRARKCGHSLSGFTGGKALIAPVYDPGPTKYWTKYGSVPIVQSIFRKVKTNEIVLQLGLKGHSKELSVPCSEAVDSSARYIRLCQGKPTFIDAPNVI